MVVFPVAGEELLVAQVRDHGGVAAGIVAVAVVGEEQAKGLVEQHVGGGGHGALHLIEDHALIAGL